MNADAFRAFAPTGIVGAEQDCKDCLPTGAATNLPAMVVPPGYRFGFGVFKQPGLSDSESPEPQPQEAPGGWSGEEILDVCRTLFHMAVAFCGATGQNVCYKHGDRPICIPLYDEHGNQIGMWLYNTYCCEFTKGKDVSVADDGTGGGSGSGEHG